MYIFPALHTERLDLVKIRHSHLPDLLELFGDPKVTEYYNLHPLTSETEALVLIDLYNKRFAESTGIRWGISIKGHEGIIGTIGYNHLSNDHIATIGFDLQTKYWNQGIISEALKTVIDFGFSELNLVKIQADVMIGNVASEKVLLKSHFVIDNSIQHKLLWDNKYHDVTKFYLYKPDTLLN